MGYSYSVNCKTQADQQAMIALLKEHRCPYLDHPYDFGDDLSYAHGRFQVGLDAISLGGSPDGFFYWTLLRWMALRAGHRLTKFSGEEFPTYPKAVPYTVYDGCEKWPLLLDSDPELKGLGPDWCRVDNYGFQTVETVLAERLFGVFCIYMQLEGWSERLNSKPLNSKPLGLEHQTPFLLEHYKEEVAAFLEPIREEIRRLDTLWEGR